MSRYYSKLHDPIVMMLLAPGQECHLDFSPKSHTYPILATRPSSSEDNLNFTLEK